MVEMGRNQDYFYPPEQSKFQKMLSQGINFSPLGMAKKGLDYLGNMLPVNRRAIMENELSGQGIMVNDIGQIVGDGGAAYKEDGSNIMAGYNANKITKDTFTKRRTKAKDNMSAAGFKEFNKALTAAEERILGTATTQTNKIFDFEEEEKNKKKKKGNVITRFLTKKKETKAAKAADNDNTTGTTGTNTTGTTNNDNNVTTTTNNNNNNGGTVPTTSPDYTPRGPNQPDPSPQTNQDAQENAAYDFARGGRAGYFFGGRVNYKIGGVVHPDGRKGFFKGAQADTAKGESMSPGTDASGDFRGGDNDDGASDNPPVTVVNNNPIDISTITKSVGNYEIPVGLKALMADKGKFQAVLNADNVLDKNLGAEFTYDKGPFNIGAYADMDGNKSLNANYINNAGSKYSFDLNEDGGRLKFAKAFANGGLAGLL
jgi:hypothetical protein